MNKIDFAIIGAGVSGTYCAWRLKKKFPEKNIVLFEYSNRIGGRLLTVKIEGVDVKAELGGMRYNPKQHKLFHKVVKELDLKTRPFPMGPKWDPSGDNNLAHFRGNFLRIGDLKNMSDYVPVIYKVNWSERNKSPDDLQRQILKTLIPDFDDLKTPQEIGESKIFEKELWQYGFWNLLYRVLSPEAYQFLKYGSGYDTNVSNGNAAVLLPTGSDYAPEDDNRTEASGPEEVESKFWTLVDGLDALPKTLKDRFEDDGGKVHINHRLRSIKKQDDGNYELSFFPTITEHNGETVDKIHGEPKNIVAEHVILAMPRMALELIEWNQWVENDFLKKNISSVLNQPAMKIFLAYDYAWWKSLDLHSGRSITDLPIRQTFYFTDPTDSDRDKTLRKKALLMASYNDIETIPFWKGLANVESEDDFYKGPLGNRATKAMVKEARIQVEVMHNQQELPEPIAAAYQDWSQKPYGAGWHCWKPNVRYWEVHPVREEKVYICGDAYSNDQGWAEGALETAEELLTKDLEKENCLEKFDVNWEIDLMRRTKYSDRQIPKKSESES